VCELIATAGRAVSLAVLVAASDRDTESLVVALEELWGALLREGPGISYELAHDLLREAVYEAMSPPQRQQRHRAMAAALEDLHADDLRPVAAELAEHHRRAGSSIGPSSTTGWRHRPQRRSPPTLAAVHHHREALEIARRAAELESPRRADALARLGVAQRSAGDPAHIRTLLGCRSDGPASRGGHRARPQRPGGERRRVLEQLVRRRS
jgi:predicted ATPase